MNIKNPFVNMLMYLGGSSPMNFWRVNQDNMLTDSELNLLQALMNIEALSDDECNNLKINCLGYFSGFINELPFYNEYKNKMVRTIKDGVSEQVSAIIIPDSIKEANYRFNQRIFIAIVNDIYDAKKIAKVIKREAFNLNYLRSIDLPLDLTDVFEDKLSYIIKIMLKAWLEDEVDAFNQGLIALMVIYSFCLERSIPKVKSSVGGKKSKLYNNDLIKNILYKAIKENKTQKEAIELVMETEFNEYKDVSRTFYNNNLDGATTYKQFKSKYKKTAIASWANTDRYKCIKKIYNELKNNKW